MIEINLVPDVKQELIRARRVRNLVVSGAIVVGLVSVGIVVLLAVYYFGVQTVRSGFLDNDIKSNAKKVQDIPDINNMLTIQSQLADIAALHDDKNISSRLFDLLAAINPGGANTVIFSLVQFNADNKSIHIDSQASNGFIAAEVFKKTIEATKFSYTLDGEKQSDSVAQDVTLSNQSYGEDATGAKVLRFSVDFTYNDNLFARSATSVTMVRPDKQDATDSYRRLPESLFGSRATDAAGGTQ